MHRKSEHGIMDRPQGWFSLWKTFLRTGTDRKVSFVLEPLVRTESSQDKGNFSVRSRPEENDPEWKPAFSHGRSENGDTCRWGEHLHLLLSLASCCNKWPAIASEWSIKETSSAVKPSSFNLHQKKKTKPSEWSSESYRPYKNSTWTCSKITCDHMFFMIIFLSAGSIPAKGSQTFFWV